MARKPIYRTLPGLDPYSDEFCRLLIRQLTGRSPIGSVMSAAVVGVASLMLASIWAVFAGLFGPEVYRAFTKTGAPDWGQIDPIAPWAAAIGGAVGLVVSYRALSRAAALSALRGALRPRIIDGGRCLNCRYSLEGLSGRDHLVVCPECGRRVPIGLGAVDLIEQMMARGEMPPEGRFAPGAENPSVERHE